MSWILIANTTASRLPDYFFLWTILLGLIFVIVGIWKIYKSGTSRAPARGHRVLVSSVDEDSGALIGSWVLSFEEYIELLRFIDSGGPSK